YWRAGAVRRDRPPVGGPLRGQARLGALLRLRPHGDPAHEGGPRRGAPPWLDDRRGRRSRAPARCRHRLRTGPAACITAVRQLRDRRRRRSRVGLAGPELGCARRRAVESLPCLGRNLVWTPGPWGRPLPQSSRWGCPKERTVATSLKRSSSDRLVAGEADVVLTRRRTEPSRQGEVELRHALIIAAAVLTVAAGIVHLAFAPDHIHEYV